VEDEHENENVGADEQIRRPAHAQLPQTSSDGCSQKRDRRQQHQPLMRLWPPSLHDGRTNQSAEHDDVPDRDGKELAWIAARRSAIAPERLHRYRNADDKYGRSEYNPSNAQTPVDVRTVSGYQNGLSNQQRNPSGKQRSMHLVERCERTQLCTAMEI